jgi:hypothetical protein
MLPNTLHQSIIILFHRFSLPIILFISIYLGPVSDSDICESKSDGLDGIRGFIIKLRAAILLIF